MLPLGFKESLLSSPSWGSYFSLLQAIKWKTKDLSQLKMLEIVQIQTQELMLPHKIPKVCTVHIILRRLGAIVPVPGWYLQGWCSSDFHRYNAFFLHQCDSSFLLLQRLCYILKCKIVFSRLLVTPLYCPVNHLTYCCLFNCRKELENNLISVKWDAQSPLFFFDCDTITQ